MTQKWSQTNRQQCCCQGHRPTYLYKQILSKVPIYFLHLLVFFLQYLFKYFYIYKANHFNYLHVIELLHELFQHLR